MTRDRLQNLLREIAVRIDEAHSPTLPDIRHQHVSQQRRFPHAGLPDDKQVPAAIIRFEAEDLPRIAIVRLPEFGELIRVPFFWLDQ